MVAEMIAISLAILLPLTKTNYLPDFHWRSVSVNAPARPIEPEMVARTSPGVSAGMTSQRRVFVFSTNRSAPENRDGSTGSFSLEPPGPLGVVASSTGGIEIDNLLVMPAAARPPRQPVTATAPTPTLRVSQGVQMAKLVKKVIPEYPPLAKIAGVSGVVHLLGVIAKDGTIQNLELIGGHPLLARAAIDAVRQWVYQPTLLNGKPVEVIAPIDVNFTLGR